VRFTGVQAVSSDISKTAGEAAQRNVEAAANFCREGSAVEIRNEDSRHLSAANGEYDFIVSDMPFGNRQSLELSSMLTSISDEMARVLKPKGRAALLLTRTHARQILEIHSASALWTSSSGFRSVVVGGWPAAVVVLERSSEMAGEREEEGDEEEDMQGEAEPTADTKKDCVLIAPWRKGCLETCCSTFGHHIYPL